MREIVSRHCPAYFAKAIHHARGPASVNAMTCRVNGRSALSPRIPALIKFYSNFSNYLTRPAEYDEPCTRIAIFALRHDGIYIHT